MSDFSEDEDYDYGSDEVVEDDDTDYDTHTAQDKGKQKSESVDYRSLSHDELQDIMTRDTTRVVNLTGLEYPIVSLLLQHFRWNDDKLLEKYMDSPSSVLREAGEPQNVVDGNSPFASSLMKPPKKRARLDTPTEAVCQVCFDTVNVDELLKLRCAHAFCNTCWTEYMTTKVKGEGECLFRCMQDGCLTYVDETSVKKLVPPACYDRYKELVLQSYVSANSTLRFCPYPACTETVHCTSGRGDSLLIVVPIVRCGKAHAFCFGCGHDADHRPVICAFVPQWMKSAREDAGTTQWIKANTRMCPKCHNNIEKNGGCNRILCRHCNYQFCWLCMKKWEVHGYNSSVCNAWQEPEPDADANEAKQNLDKWLFYFDRFNNHELSARLDQDLCEKTNEKMVEVQETGWLSWIEAKFMQNAVDELTECRLSLKWSYVMAYFLQPGNQKQIFEDLQADLEKAVEELSQMLEEPIEAQTVKSLRQRMVDKTVYVRQRREILLNDTAAGLAEGRWLWTMPPE